MSVSLLFIDPLAPYTTLSPSVNPISQSCFSSPITICYSLQVESRMPCPFTFVLTKGEKKGGQMPQSRTKRTRTRPTTKRLAISHWRPVSTDTERRTRGHKSSQQTSRDQCLVESWLVINWGSSSSRYRHDEMRPSQEQTDKSSPAFPVSSRRAYTNRRLLSKIQKLKNPPPEFCSLFLLGTW